MKQLNKYTFFYVLSGSVYFLIEYIYRSYSKMEMFCLAGFCGLILMGLNNLFTYEMDFLLQCFISMCFITLGELIVGILFNQDYHIWDYRDSWLNYKGQICPLFSSIWFVFAGIFIPVLDYIDWRFFGYKPEIPPYYKVFGKKIFQFKQRII